MDISNWTEKVREINLEPSKFFEEKDKEGFAEPSKFVAGVGAFLGLLVTAFVFIGSIFTSESLLAGIILSVIVIPLLAVMLIANAFLQSLLVHLAVYISGSRGLDTTYNAVAYAIGATGIYAWIPILNLFAAVYSIYLQAKGVEILHDMSFGRALLCVAWPIVLSILMAIGIVMLAVIGAFGMALA